MRRNIRPDRLRGKNAICWAKGNGNVKSRKLYNEREKRRAGHGTPRKKSDKEHHFRVTASIKKNGIFNTKKPGGGLTKKGKAQKKGGRD